ncbi:glycoside hydrolase family 15 protein [Crocosphaera sp.]|uniref:glycoside hydrolase family 15 protein n=1 Tax=Crocosphaera sp. TaxID=2729996 RepID=UPI003F20A7F4
MMIQNETISQLIQAEYSPWDIQEIVALLKQQNTFNFPILENGLFPAAAVVSTTEYTGYGNVWVRDNIYLAYAHYVCGQTDIATKTVKTLIHYFQKHQSRFLNIINSQVDQEEVMQRPHIRFNGQTLEEIDQEWNHAQNDALGYFVWFYCKLVREKNLETNIKELEGISLFIAYFDAIQYWQDEDSGHWEEDRKIEASSIGVVVAALTEFKQLLQESPLANNLTENNRVTDLSFLSELITKGKKELHRILPSDCIQEEPKNRRYDSALLFLIYPLQIIEGKIAEQILIDVINNLQGDYGIRRYLKDSFWCKNYKDIPPKIRTTLSIDREQWFKDNNRELQLGEEAQWCIFDPILSAIFGLKFQRTKDDNDLDKQTHYLNRSLGQITASDSSFGGFKCPELYYLEKQAYVPGDATPLLWTQANLKVALEMMKRSLL